MPLTQPVKMLIYGPRRQSTRPDELLNTSLAPKSRTTKKPFFAYARCKAKSRATVKPLVGPDGIEVQNPAQITKLFKKQFSSVCTTENKMEVPRPRTIFTGSDYDKLCYFAKAFDKIPHRRLMFVKKHMASMVAW